jgi:hypothetical protein
MVVIYLEGRRPSMYLCTLHHPQMEYPRIELWGIVVAGRYAERYRDSGVVPSKDSSRYIKAIVACHSTSIWTAGDEQGDADDGLWESGGGYGRDRP